MFKKLLISFLTITLLVGCATTEVAVRKEAIFTKNDSIIVRSEHGDHLSFQPIIEKNLVDYGYKIVSGKKENPKYVFRYRYTCLPGDPGNLLIPYGPCKVSAALLPINGDKPVVVIHHKHPSPLTLKGFIKDMIESMDQKLTNPP